MNDEKNCQLFCLAYSGGKTTVFKEIGNLLNNNIEKHYIEYPGRCTRAKEPFIRDYNEFLDDIAMQISARRNNNLPCAVFGYSIGALFAYDLVARGMIGGEIKHIFLGGSCSADLHEKVSITLSGLGEPEFWDKVISMGGVSEALIANKKFLKLFSKTLRADFYLGEQYVFDDKLPLPDCSATILYSDNDTPKETVIGWNKLFGGNVDFEEYDGDHFFAFEDYKRTANIINERLHA